MATFGAAFTDNYNDMKYTILTLGFLLTTLVSAWSQSAPAQPAASSNDPAARAATDALVAKYNLNADQAKQMYTIQARKQRNLAQIADLKTSDPALYQTKMKSVQTGTLASIRRILKTKEQVDLFEKTKVEVRNQRAIKQKELMGKGAKKAEIEAALLDIYAE